MTDKIDPASCYNILQMNAQQDVDISIRKETVLGRNRLVPDSLGNQISVQHWRTEDIEPRVVDLQVIQGMTRARDTGR